tara:strand:+ start:117 stop:365 length:249 start_codon:yes stop_codon:yes gene_type:complete
MWFFKNGAGWLVKHNKGLKPQASRRSQAPIFRQQATVTYLKIRDRHQAPSNKPLRHQASSRKRQAEESCLQKTNGKCPEPGT